MLSRGYNWLTAQGMKKTVAKAKKHHYAAVIASLSWSAAYADLGISFLRGCSNKILNFVRQPAD